MSKLIKHLAAPNRRFPGGTSEDEREKAIQNLANISDKIYKTVLWYPDSIYDHDGFGMSVSYSLPADLIKVYKVGHVTTAPVGYLFGYSRWGNAESLARWDTSTAIMVGSHQGTKLRVSARFAAEISSKLISELLTYPQRKESVERIWSGPECIQLTGDLYLDPVVLMESFEPLYVILHREFGEFYNLLQESKK